MLENVVAAARDLHQSSGIGHTTRIMTTMQYSNSLSLPVTDTRLGDGDNDINDDNDCNNDNLFGLVVLCE